MKITKFDFLIGSAQYIARENDPAPATPAADATPAPVTPAVPVPAADEGIVTDKKTFTQDEVNEIVVKRNKALKSQYEQLETNYQGLLDQSNLSGEQREKLETDLENVRTQLRTKEQQAAHDAKKLQETHNKALEETVGRADYYKNLFESSTTERAIVEAATQHGAYNASQFIAILGSRTKIVDELNEQGEKTGRLVPRVEMTVTGEDGTPSVVLKTPEAAIEDLKNDTTQFGNLFRNNVAKGIGEGTSSNAANPTRVDVTTMTDDEYFANREAIRKQYKLRDKPRV